MQNDMDGNNRKKYPVELKDDSILLVKGVIDGGPIARKKYVKDLTNATLTVFDKFGYAQLRCVGAESINNATKASANARKVLAEEGVDLIMIDSFVDVDFEDYHDRSGFLKRLEPRNPIKKES